MTACKLCHDLLPSTTTLAYGTPDASGCVCDVGFLTDPSPPANVSLQCLEFPDHLSSTEANATLRYLHVDADYWRPAYRTTTARLCPRRGSCNGGLTPDASYNRFANATCTPGRGLAGAYCALCMEPTYYFNVYEGRCTPCGVWQEQLPALSFYLSIGVALGFGVVLFYTCQASPLDKIRQIVRIYAARVSFRAKARVLISLTQILTQIQDVYDVRFPSEYQALLEVLSIINFDPTRFLPTVLSTKTLQPKVMN